MDAACDLDLDVVLLDFDLDLDLDLELDLDRCRAADVVLPRDLDVTDLLYDFRADRDVVDDDELCRRLRATDDDDDDADFDVELLALPVDLVAERFNNNDTQLSYSLTLIAYTRPLLPNLSVSLKHSAVARPDRDKRLYDSTK